MILWMDRKIQNDGVVVVDVCYDRGNRKRMGVEDVCHEVVVVVVVDAVGVAVDEMDDSLNLLLHVVVEHAAFESVVVDRYPCDDEDYDGDDGNHHTEG